MANLSIVIPWSGDEQSFETTLVSVLQNRPTGAEVIVAHRGAYDDPYELSGDVQFIPCADDTTLPQLINEAVWEAEGEIVHVLLCGAAVCEGWTRDVIARFDDPEVGMVAPLILAEQATRRVFCCGINYRKGGGRKLVAANRTIEACQKAKPLGPALLAGFYRREALLDVDGFGDEVGEQLCDIDMAMMLQTLGYRCHVEQESLVVVEAPNSTSKRGFRFGRGAERLFWRQAPHVGWGKSLFLHSLEVAGDSLAGLLSGGAVGQLAGRLVGLLEAPRHASFHRRMRTLPGPETPHDGRDIDGTSTEVRRAA